ncbi:hypothetical protein BJX70DRAFT_396067 [Aspergillus crustosus]
MHFSKILSTGLFAAFTVAAPLPAPQISVDFGTIQQLSQSIQSFAANTGNGISQISSQSQAVSPGLGAVADAFNQLFSQFQQAGAQLQETSAKIAATLNSLTSSYEQTEQSASAELAASLSRRDDLYEWPTHEWNSGGLTQAGDEPEMLIGVPVAAHPVSSTPEGTYGVPVAANPVPATGYGYYKRDIYRNPQGEYPAVPGQQTGEQTEPTEPVDGLTGVPVPAGTVGVPVAANPVSWTGY